MIRTHSLGRKPYETFCRVAKYYIDKNYSKKDTRKQLDIFLLQYDASISLPKWSDTLDRAVNRALKYKAVTINFIEISKPEMERIDALDGKQIQKLAFTLLCLAKYWSLVNPNNDCWVNNKDSEIMKMANISTTIKKQSKLYYTLNKLGLIRFSKKIDNTNIRVNFIENGDPVLSVANFTNLGYQYLKYKGEPYFECENCGTTVKLKKNGSGRKPKYCNACATEKYIQQKVDYAVRNKNITYDKNNKPDYTVYMHIFPNGKKYIGMTRQMLKVYWRNGKRYEKRSVYKAIEEYGWENIKHYVLFQTSNYESAKQAKNFYINRNLAYIDEYGYNDREININPETLENMLLKHEPFEVDGNGFKIAN